MLYCINTELTIKYHMVSRGIVCRLPIFPK